MSRATRPEDRTSTQFVSPHESSTLGGINNISLHGVLENQSAISMGISVSSQGQLGASSGGLVESLSPRHISTGATSWSEEQVLYLSNAGSRIFRGMRQIATCAMLSSVDVVVPATNRFPPRGDAMEAGTAWHWLYQVQPIDAQVPCPPIRFAESLRVFPPAWETPESFEVSELAFLFAKDR